MASFVAVVDANVLFSVNITELMGTLASPFRLFQPHWSPEILAEVARNVRLKRPDVDIDRRIAQLNQWLPDACVEPPRDLIDTMLVNKKDRHVLALAVHVGAPVIITENLRDFPPVLCDRYEIGALSADDFVLSQVHLSAATVAEALAAMAARRRRPPMTAADVREQLRGQLPKAMAGIDDWTEAMGPARSTRLRPGPNEESQPPAGSGD